MNILIFNAGSNSLKFSLIEAECERTLAEGEIDWSANVATFVYRRPGETDVHRKLNLAKHSDALGEILDQLKAEPPAELPDLRGIRAIGHRVVHGGTRHTAAVLVTAEVRRELAELTDLAPLHNPASLEVMNGVDRLLPGIPQVAAFDTAFHATLGAAARTYAVPRAWTRDWGIRRYGFHGLSHAYCSARVAEITGRSDLRLIIAHLGGGASISAVHNGACVDTSMGFTPMDGLMMGTRSGAVDPGILIYALRHKGMSVDQLDHALNHESGLLGVSGISSDMRQVLAAAPSHPDARLAIDLYVHRIRQTIGAMAAALGGVDALVFTAGVGEHAAKIRVRVCENFGYLGLDLDPDANDRCHPDTNIASSSSTVRIFVIATREDITIVREVGQLTRALTTLEHT